MRATVESSDPINNADDQGNCIPTSTVASKSLPTTHSHNETWKPPPSAWIPQCHPCAKEVAQDVDQYFLLNWPFPNQKSKRTFLDAGFSRVTCLYFPLAKDDRIEYPCRLLTVLFLIDGEKLIARFLSAQREEDGKVLLMTNDLKISWNICL